MANGCLTPIIVWDKTIVDGHNRYEICMKHGISFDVKEEHFNNEAEALLWITAQQLTRRNLTPVERVVQALKEKPTLKELGKAKQGFRSDLHHLVVDGSHNTRHILAKMADVKPWLVGAIEYINAHGDESLQKQVLTGEISPSAAMEIIKGLEWKKEDERLKREAAKAAKQADMAVEERHGIIIPFPKQPYQGNLRQTNLHQTNLQQPSWRQPNLHHASLRQPDQRRDDSLDASDEDYASRHRDSLCKPTPGLNDQNSHFHNEASDLYLDDEMLDDETLDDEEMDDETIDDELENENQQSQSFHRPMYKIISDDGTIVPSDIKVGPSVHDIKYIQQKFRDECDDFLDTLTDYLSDILDKDATEENIEEIRESVVACFNKVLARINKIPKPLDRPNTN